MTELLTKDEVAGKLKITVRGLQKMMKRREISYIKIGRSVRFEEAAIKKTIDKRTIAQK